MEGTIFQTVSDFILKYLPLVTGVVGTFALIATMTPNKADDRIVQFLLDITNFLGGNIGNASNKTDV